MCVRAYQACTSGAVADRMAKGRPIDRVSTPISHRAGAVEDGSPNSPLMRSGSTKAAITRAAIWTMICRRTVGSFCRTWA